MYEVCGFKMSLALQQLSVCHWAAGFCKLQHARHLCFAKPFQAGKGMGFCGSSQKPSVCKLRKTTIITFAFPSYLDVTASTRTSSCLTKSLNFSECSVYVLREERFGIPALCAHSPIHFPLLLLQIKTGLYKTASSYHRKPKTLRANHCNV